MFIILASAFAAGFGLHKTKRFFDSFGVDLSFLARCAVGITCMYPFDQALFLVMPIQDMRLKHFISFWTIVTFYGGGVIFGYLFGGGGEE
jgi:hypothetical protein